MISKNVVDYVILTREVVRDQKRSKEVKFEYYSQGCNFLWTCSYDTLKYYRLCYFDLRDQQRSLDVISEVIRGYWRSNEVKIGIYSQGCNFLWIYSYHTPKYYRICYFDLRGHQRSLEVISEVLRGYWRLKEINIRICLQGCIFLWRIFFQRYLEVIEGLQKSKRG